MPPNDSFERVEHLKRSVRRRRAIFRREIDGIEREIRARLSEATSRAASTLTLRDSRLARQMHSAQRRLHELVEECQGERRKCARRMELSALRSAEASERERTRAREDAALDLFFVLVGGLPAPQEALTGNVRRVATLDKRTRHTRLDLSPQQVVDLHRQHAEHDDEPERCDPGLLATSEPIAWLALCAPQSCFEDTLDYTDPCLFSLATNRVYRRLEGPLDETGDEYEMVYPEDGGPALISSSRDRFAPCTVSEILDETSRLFAFTRPTPIRNDEEKSPARMVPRALTEEAVGLLRSAFTRISNDSIDLVAAACPRGTRFSVLPRNHSTALIVASRGSEESVREESRADVCDWRACFADGQTVRRRTLCSFHRDLSEYVGDSESLRYLPCLKKKKESTLLSELCNGKLATTVAVFCDKAADEAKSSSSRKPRLEEVEEEIALAKSSTAMVETIAAIERAASAELEQCDDHRKARKALEIVKRIRPPPPPNLDQEEEEDEEEEGWDDRLRFELDFAKRKLAAFKAIRESHTENASIDCRRPQRKTSKLPLPSPYAATKSRSPKNSRSVII